MSKVIYLSPSNHGTGANKCLKSGCYEDKHTRPIAEACKKYLDANGFKTYIAGKKTGIKARCAESDKLGADWHIPIHTNAFKDPNVRYLLFMCYSTTGEYRKMFDAVAPYMQEIYPGNKTASLSQNRGLFEVNKPKAKSLYCELGFHTNKTDVDKFIHNSDAVGKALAKGICKYYNVTFKDIEEKSEAKPKYKTSQYAKDIKTGLRKLGYYNGNIDSYVTPEYTEAVKKFQSKAFKRKSDIDGIGGIDTLKAVDTFVNFIGIKHFTPDEFRCKCGHCTGYPEVVDRQLLLNLDDLRAKNGSITITSGLRCKWKNSSLSGSSSTSRHMRGKAADFYNAKLTATRAKRVATIKAWYKYKKANYAYGNTAGMGNAVHADVK